MRMGDIFKVYYLRKWEGLPYSRNLELIFWAHFLDMNMLLLLSTVATWLLGTWLAFIPLLSIVTCGWLLLLLFQNLPELGISLIKYLPMARFRNMSQKTLDLLVLRCNFPSLIIPIVYTIVAWCLSYALFFIFFTYVIDLNLICVQILVVQVAIAAGLSIPSSPGGIGVYEAIMIYVLSEFGIPKEEALAAAVVLHLNQHLPPMLYTLFLFRSNPVSHAKKVKDAF